MKTTAEQIDIMAAAYDAKEDEVEKAKAELKNMKEELIALVEKEGLAAPKSAKTRLLDGDAWEIKATFGQSTEVVEANVLKLKAACVREGKTSLFSKMFSTDIRYSLRRTARVAAQLAPAKIKDLFGTCLSISSSTPSLKVEKKKLAKIAGERSQKASA
jgi:hypothetical protein